MFKTNLSPLNPTKEKYINNIYQQANPDLHNMSNHHQSGFQYKAMHAGNQNQNFRQDGNILTGNYNPPLGPLSPNVSKNPMSPTAKIKMYSNAGTLNKKPSINSNNLMQQNTHEGLPK